MSLPLQTEAPPLRVDDSGAIRVGETRVLLELVIDSFERGETPEQIVESYPSLCLGDVYAVIGYYLRHREAVREYLEERRRLGDAVRARIEAQQGDLKELREKLLTRWEERQA